MDGLENLLSGLRIKKAAYTRVEANAPWGLDFNAYPHTKFGIVSEGQCYIDLKNGDEPIHLERGSCYMLPRGNPFRIRHVPDGDAEKFEDAVKRLEGRVLRCGLEGDQTVVTGGQFIFTDNRYPLVFDLLPPLISFRVNVDELDAMHATLRLLEKEVTQPGPGARAMIDNLANIFFVQTLRTYLLDGGKRSNGWAGLMADERLGKAIRLIHAKSDQNWSLSTLAAKSGMSRAAFAANFRKKLGISPIAYLTRHRMQLAKEMLLHSRPIGIARIADKIGYDSEASFSKAFKREFGLPPAEWRARYSACDR